MLFTDRILNPLMASMTENSERNALCIKEKYYTYAQLSARIIAIRTVIREVGERHVGLVNNDDLDTYASIFALWMEGKCYIPLHPGQPLGRNDDIIAQVGITTVLDSSEETRYHACHVILTKSVPNLSETVCTPPMVCGDEEFAYILFTSGSTGKPKGVPISRGNLAAFVDSVEDLGIRLNNEDRCLQMFDLTFDLSVQSYLLPLLSGACLYTVSYDQIKYQAVFELIDDNDLTMALMVPSVIHCLRPYYDEICDKSMRYCLFCGEALLKDDAVAWAECVPNAQIWNVYGPTEDTIYCTAYRMDTEENIKQMNGAVCIGKAMKNDLANVFDENGNICEAQQKGELCLAGEQLTSGYWHNDEKNHETFFFSTDGTRWYRTGDICLRDPDGDILYYGRKDSQIKVQGYRVELSEIECVARDHYEGKKAVIAVPVYDKQGNCQIQLAVEGVQEDKQMLMEHLKKFLPAYMIPTEVVYFGKFPQNANNKIDRKEIAKEILNR